MDNQKIQEKVKELSDKICKYQKELDDIRNQCKHKDSKIELCHLEKGSTIRELRKICLYCGDLIGYPNKEEIEKWSLDE